MKNDIEKHQFKKGRSGNPKGRPKKLPELQQALADELADELPVIIRRLVSMAKAGNLKAAEMLLAYAYGKPRQSTDISVSDETSQAHAEAMAIMSRPIYIVPRPPEPL